MLINDEDVGKRLGNPLNLLNRMKEGLHPVKRNAMDLFTRGKSVSVPASDSASDSDSTLVPARLPAARVINSPPSGNSLPSSDDIIDDVDSKIKLATAHDRALDLLNTSLGKLQEKVNSDQVKASTIPSIVASASKVITEIRKERVEREKKKDSDNVHYHFYCPEARKIEEYEVIEVNG